MDGVWRQNSLLEKRLDIGYNSIIIIRKLSKCNRAKNRFQKKCEMDKLRLSKIFKALSNPNRLELYLEIAKTYETSFQTDGECFISDICNSLKIGAPTISHHLKELTNADLITTERRGKFLVARLNEKTIQEANKILSFQKKEW